MDDIIVKTALVARTYLYRVFQAVFGDDPTEEVLAALFSDTTDQAVECFEAVDSIDFAKALALFAACRKGYAEDPAGYLEEAKQDYMHVLVGPEDLKAPPWECVYLTNERVLFQEATLKVREAYRSENMLPSQYPRVSDDHLAIELDFMVKLSEKTQKAFDEGMRTNIGACFRCSVRFGSIIRLLGLQTMHRICPTLRRDRCTKASAPCARRFFPSMST